MKRDGDKEWKRQQEALRERMRDARTGWATAQRNLTWGERQRPTAAAVTRRVHEQSAKWRREG